jgi:hypothetical protein
LKNVTTFSKKVETFSNARAGGKIKRRQFRMSFGGLEVGIVFHLPVGM